MTSETRTSSTAASAGSWVEAGKEVVRPAISASTQVIAARHALMLQARFVKGPEGRQEVMVSVDAASVERKLAIRELNAELEGRSGGRADTSKGV